jgi:hypothetical protein
MATTNAAYIKEFSLFDEVMTYIHECDEDVMNSYVEYTALLHKADMESFFEAEDPKTKEEVSEKKESFFAKIGNHILKLIEKITKFISAITEKILSFVKKSETDEEKVDKLLKQHPELKNQVVEGINKEWFTYKDVATYEKDVVGLCKMLEQSKIDHKTFMQKLSDAAKKFNDSAAPILGAATTVIGFIGLAGKLKKSADDSKNALSSWKKKLTEFSSTVKGYKEEDASTIQAIFSAYNEISAAKMDDARKHTAAIGNYDGFLGNLLNSKLGTKLGLDDQSRRERYENKAAHDRWQKGKKDEQNDQIESNIQRKTNSYN